MHSVVLDPRVPGKLREIAEWWAENRSPEQAARWLEAIAVAIENIGTNPRGFGLIEESDRFDDEIRQMLFGLGRKATHRVLFTIDEDEVYVIDVRHVAQRPITRGDL
jgi:plasmid stabilization system protein ParE